jgi:hypothetical protein
LIATVTINLFFGTRSPKKAWALVRQARPAVAPEPDAI